MKISQLIQELGKVMEVNGDIDCFVADDAWDMIVDSVREEHEVHIVILKKVRWEPHLRSTQLGRKRPINPNLDWRYMDPGDPVETRTNLSGISVPDIRGHIEEIVITGDTDRWGMHRREARIRTDTGDLVTVEMSLLKRAPVPDSEAHTAE